MKLKLIKHDRKYKIKFQETIFRCKRHFFLEKGAVCTEILSLEILFCIFYHVLSVLISLLVIIRVETCVMEHVCKM